MATTIKEFESLVSGETEEIITPANVCEAIDMYLKITRSAEAAELHTETELSTHQAVVEPGPYGGYYSSEAQLLYRRADTCASLAHKLMKKSGVAVEVDSQLANAYMFKNDGRRDKIINENPGQFPADQVYPGHGGVIDFYDSSTETWLRVESGDIDIKPAQKQP
jgi:hypothetical protein